MISFLLVGLGGAAGSMFRYGMQRWLNAAFPIGTLVVNLLGCLLIGMIWALTIKNNLSSNYRLLLMTGFCGGFTTFSAFTTESILLLENGRFLYFTIYFFCSTVLGLLATFAGYKLMNNF